MKTFIIIISVVLVSFTFSSCHLLDNIIPEEYFAEDESSNSEYTIVEHTINSEYIWIGHSSGIQCEVTFFKNLDQAIRSLRSLGIICYDSERHDGACHATCGSSTGIIFRAKIKSKDLRKIENTRWFVYYNR